MVASVFPAKLADRQPFATKLLTNAVTRNRLSHAYLLTGRAQIDKREIARYLACFLNCAHLAAGNAEQVCTLKVDTDAPAPLQNTGFCQNCRWIWQGKHPQAWLTLANETSRSGKISVEKARNLSGELAKESQFVRVVVVEEAGEGTFHRPAANALLKTIEDPKVSCVFMLFANASEDVLPTVVSRCQLLPLRTTESLGLSLKNPDLSKYGCEAVDMAKDLIEKYIHRHDANSLSRIIDFNKALTELFTDEFTPSDAVDLLVGVDLHRLADRAITEPALSGYAKQLVTLAEATKEQLEHYVSPKAAIETFTVSWWRFACTTV